MALWRKNRGYLVAGAGVLAAGSALAAAFLVTSGGPARAEGGSFLRDGEAGFVVTQFAYALGKDAGETGACPNGMSKNVAEIFQETPEGQRRPGESDGDYGDRIDAGGKAISSTADGKNFCFHPQLAPLDPHARAMESLSVPAGGIDLDGKDARTPARLADFTGLDGAKGVDNQFFRVVGCSRSFQSDGSSNGFQTEMYTGSWGILVRLRDVDDLRNDDHVEVGVFANADPIQLSPTREALEYATYALDQDPAYRGETTGRLVNGVLVTEPFDMQVHNVVNGMILKRPLKAARIRASLSKDGTLKGYIAGYTPVEAMYDLQFGYRNGMGSDGKPSPMGRRLGSANGAARVLGHTCQGVYQALNRFADGHPDPKTGKFTSISTQYRFEAKPAFTVDVDTQSQNEKLVRND